MGIALDLLELKDGESALDGLRKEREFAEGEPTKLSLELVALGLVRHRSRVLKLELDDELEFDAVGLGLGKADSAWDSKGFLDFDRELEPLASSRFEPNAHGSELE